MIKRLMKKKEILLVASLMFVILLGLTVYAQIPLYQPNDFTQENYQTYQPSFQSFYSKQGIDYKTFWPALSEPDKCEARQDFIVNIRPGSCTPTVVRSDLLEEQNVPVFCKLDAIKLNPLIDVASVKSVRFKGEYPKEVAGISFHPSQAALRLYNRVLDSPLINDVGYVVVALKRMEEKDMPSSVRAELSAVLTYDMENVFGSGKTGFYLPVIGDSDWAREYKKNAFWTGRGYVRADWVERDSAGISIYTDANNILRKLILRKGETSPLVYMPGFYCSGGIQVKLNDLSAGKVRARIKVDDEDEKWIIEGERIMDGACRVRKITGLGGGAGQVVLSCRGQSVVLKVGVANIVKLKVLGEGGEGRDVRIGEWVNLGVERPSEKIYLAYSGRTKVIEENKEEEKLFVILAKNVNEAEIEEGKINPEVLTYIVENMNKWIRDGKYSFGLFSGSKGDWQEYVKGKIHNLLGSDRDEEIDIIFEGVAGKNTRYTFTRKAGIRDKTCEELLKDEQPDVEKKEDCKKLEAYYSKANATAFELVKFYGNEKKDTGNYYGAEGLWELAELSGKLSKQETQKKVLQILKDKYPDSYFTKKATEKLENLDFYDYEYAGSLVTAGMQTSYVRLESVEMPGLEEASAEFSVKIEGKESSRYALIGEYVVEPELGKGELLSEYIRLVELDDDKIIVDYKYKVEEEGQTILKREAKKEMKVGDSLTLGKDENIVVTLTKINLKRLAEVELISKIPSGTSEANFTFEVGIEKRAIKLSPEKTEELIVNLNKSIEKFEEITETLGDVVKVWKGACFATSGVLIAKNFLFNSIGGRGAARQAAMRGPGGWIDNCSREVAAKKYTTLDNCLFEKRTEIGASIDEIQGKMNDMDKKIREVNKAHTKTVGLFGKQIDSQAAAEEFANEHFIPFVNENNEVPITVAGTERKVGDLGDNEEIMSMVKRGELSISNMRDIMLYGSLKTGSNAEIAKGGLSEKLETALEFADDAKVRAGYEQGIKNEFNAKIHTIKRGREEMVDVGKLTSVQAEKLDAKAGNEYVILSTPQTFKAGNGKYVGKVIYVPLKQISGDRYYYDSSKSGFVLTTAGQKGPIIDDKDMNLILSELNVGGFIKISRGMCENKYINPAVKYHETEPNKGAPAVVPIDVGNGWYAATKQILPGFGIQAYKQSGAVSSLWLCNVGRNGREEWGAGVSDDRPCIQVNFDTGQPLTQIPCLDEGEGRKLALRAKAIVEDAAAQYGRQWITLASGRFKAEAALKSEGTQCQDFMSPEDCAILFNVCDPVLCPPSRCDLGGRFPVDNVIQSGVIGSLTLCLPNFVAWQGQVLVPVCLTGVQAGLDSYVSIMRSLRDCYQESLDTGKFVGICDEIYSIYLCEFFWRQLAPFIDVGLPRLVELAYTGGQVRGGGEYLSVSNAWDTAQKSVSYITEVYGVSSFEAFRERSTAEVGTEVCKQFVSTRYPTSKKMLNQLLEPDSPVQFTGRFDEFPFSEATVPATSQYKVYFHIYAGKDSGHYYTVYLRNPPSTPYYASQPTVIIDTGYVGIGQEIDKTEDRTFPAGYKEMCIRIDEKDECGFKSVSTEFALEYLKEFYVKEQVETEVKTEKECVSGSPSLLPLAQPSLEGITEATTSPAIYKRGVIRVCSSDNPGENTNPNRWIAVGYCGDEKIKCWLDKESVADAMKDVEFEKGVLENAQEISNKIEQTGAYSEEISGSRLSNARKNLGAFKFAGITSFPDDPEDISDVKNLIASFKDIEDKGFFNKHKAEAKLNLEMIFLKLTERFAVHLKILVGEVGVEEAEGGVADEGAEAEVGEVGAITSVKFLVEGEIKKSFNIDDGKATKGEDKDLATEDNIILKVEDNCRDIDVKVFKSGTNTEIENLVTSKKEAVGGHEFSFSPEQEASYDFKIQCSGGDLIEIEKVRIFFPIQTIG